MCSTKYALAFDNIENVLDSRSTGTKTPLARKLGYIYLEFRQEDRVLFTNAELVKLHRAFVHPLAEKLLKLLKRVKPHDLPSDTLTKLQKIADVCATCRETAVPQQRFKVAFTHDGRFAEEIALDLQYVDGISLLHVVDLTTVFGAAQWLQSATVEAVWETFLECWATVYVGYPNTMRTDAGSIFVSPKWKRFADSTKIKLMQSGVEAHNSSGIGEKYHDPLRRVYQNVKKGFPNMSLELALRLAVKAMNDTMGPNGLVPSLLVFGMVPRFPVIDEHIPNQDQRALAMKVSREEYQKLEGLYATYVDDSFTAGTPGFLARTTLTERKFESKPRRYDNVTYSAVESSPTTTTSMRT
jgi:hypothetical protein